MKRANAQRRAMDPRWLRAQQSTNKLSRQTIPRQSKKTPHTVGQRCTRDERDALRAHSSSTADRSTATRSVHMSPLSSPRLASYRPSSNPAQRRHAHGPRSTPGWPRPDVTCNDVRRPHNASQIG
eukprot:scaffold2713_cov24-Tisochrysis_lutea.AAC.1